VYGVDGREITTSPVDSWSTRSIAFRDAGVADAELFSPVQPVEGRRSVVANARAKRSAAARGGTAVTRVRIGRWETR
jgi:hypothetical protein